MTTGVTILEEVQRDRDCNVTIKQESTTKTLTVSQILNFICTIVEQRIIMKSLDPLRAKKTFIRKKFIRREKIEKCNETV